MVSRQQLRRRAHGLLVDLDDVAFFHPEAQQAVANSAVRFVADRVGVNRNEAVALNRHLYMTHGHTLLGMRAELGLNVTLAEFNAAVYSSRTLQEVSCLTQHPRTLARAAEMRRLVARMHCGDVGTYVFTNAPRVWCDFALREIGLARLFAPEQLLTSDTCYPGVDPNDIILKPSWLSYDLATRCAGTSSIMFVDDSSRNLEAAPTAWRKYLMCNNGPPETAENKDATPITHLDQVAAPVVSPASPHGW